MIFVNVFVKKTVIKIEQTDRKAGRIRPDEYMEYESEVFL